MRRRRGGCVYAQDFMASIGMVGDTGPSTGLYWWQFYPSGQPRFIYPMFASALLWPAVPLRMRFAANAP